MDTSAYEHETNANNKQRKKLDQLEISTDHDNHQSSVLDYT